LRGLTPTQLCVLLMGSTLPHPRTLQMEEQVTAVAAADTVDDDIADAVLAGGDPDSDTTAAPADTVGDSMEPERTNLDQVGKGEGESGR
jgi:hypothetical protein